ncbi:hypothetical protein [Janibacter sp. GS2]|uniref:hypothetical protein n=1 Tax=Janibacter sp. GS2 TaxID=3442646 RepID=UPI003EBE8C9C
MSYPAPPPPGQGGPVGPGGPNPPQPNPYAAGGNPYGQPPKKDTTLWWILGIIGAVIVVCCIGVIGFFGWVVYAVDDQLSSATSSVSDGRASSADEISEGSQATDNGATVRSGWTITPSEELSGVTLRNDGTSRNMLQVTFYFMQDGDVLEEASCTSTFLDPGETDDSPTCLDPIGDIAGYDEIRFTEGS